MKISKAEEPRARLDRLVESYLSWDLMVSTGRDEAGERVVVDGLAATKVKAELLAEIGRAAVEARRAPMPNPEKSS